MAVGGVGRHSVHQGPAGSSGAIAVGQLAAGLFSGKLLATRGSGQRWHTLCPPRGDREKQVGSYSADEAAALPCGVASTWSGTQPSMWHPISSHCRPPLTPCACQSAESTEPACAVTVCPAWCLLISGWSLLQMLLLCIPVMLTIMLCSLWQQLTSWEDSRGALCHFRGGGHG